MREDLNPLACAICDELGIDVPESPLTLDVILVIRQVVKKGAAYWQFDDGDHETTLKCLKEISDTAGWGYDHLHETRQIVIYNTEAIEVL